MKKTELAPLLGISISMVSRLAKRGMPTDSLERAKRWRRRHLEPSRVKGVKFDPRGADGVQGATAPASSVLSRDADGVATVEAVGRRADALAQKGEFAAIEEELRLLLRSLPGDAQPLLTARVWIALTDYHLHPDAGVRTSAVSGDHLTPDGFAHLVSGQTGWGVVWFDAACDWDDVSKTGWLGEQQPPRVEFEGSEP